MIFLSIEFSYVIITRQLFIYLFEKSKMSPIWQAVYCNILIKIYREKVKKSVIVDDAYETGNKKIVEKVRGGARDSKRSERTSGTLYD